MSDIKAPPFTIGYNEAVKALNDDSFLNAFPVFKTIRGKADMLKNTAGVGCSSCRQKQIAKSLLTDFLNILRTLPPEDVANVKKYYGAEKLMYTAYDKTKGINHTTIV